MGGWSCPEDTWPAAPYDVSDWSVVEWLFAAGATFAAIAPVELPDKTFVATLVLATRYRPLAVWLGVTCAFAVHVTLAVAAGGVIGLLPDLPVRLAAAGLFIIGGLIMLRGARQADDLERQQEQEFAHKVPDESRAGARAFGASFLLLFMAEWGDLSQLLIAGLVASGQPPTAVFVGAFTATVAVAGAAVLLGRWILRHVRLSLVRYVAAAVCGAIAAAILVATLM